MTETRKNWLIGIAVTFGVLGAGAGFVIPVCLHWMSDYPSPHEPGEFVIWRVTGERGQILRNYWKYGRWSYQIRFTRFGTVTMQEFEIEPAFPVTTRPMVLPAGRQVDNR